MRCFADGSVRIDAAPSCATSDERGHFHCAGIACGAVSVRVDAPGFAPWCSRIDSASASEEILAQLTRGIELSGTVALADGRPAEGALVRVRYASEHSLTASTDASGAFALEHVPAGAIVVEARAHGFGPPTIAAFDASEGTTLSWNPTVEPERVIEGTVLGPDDHPVAIWLVKAVPEIHEVPEVPEARGASSRAFTLENWVAHEVFGDPSERVLQCWTDNRGHFRVPCRGRGPHRLELRSRTHWENAPQAQLSGVHAGARDVVMRYAPAGAWVRGRIALARTDAPPCNLIAIATRDGSDTQSMSDAHTGEFKLGPLPAGEYEIVAWPQGSLPQSFGRHDVSRGTTVDLGARRVDG